MLITGPSLVEDMVVVSTGFADIQEACYHENSGSSLFVRNA